MGLPAPIQVPQTTPKTLTFRVIYQLLLFALNEPQGWDVRSSVLDSSGLVDGRGPDYLAEIASARAALVHYSKEAQQKKAFWAVLRDGRCLALLQENGTLHRPEAEPVNLTDIYDAKHRDILRTAMKARQVITSET